MIRARLQPKKTEFKMNEKVKNDYVTESRTGKAIPVTAKELGNNVKRQLEVLGSMETYVSCGMAMLDLCDRFATKSSVPGITDVVANGITNVALECAAVMWFCAGVDKNSDDQSARQLVARWEEQLTPHDRRLLKGIRTLRNELHGHRGGKGDRQHKREVSVRLLYLFGDLGEPMVEFNAGDDAANIKRLFERMTPSKRAELRSLMYNALEWLWAEFEKEKDRLANRVLGRNRDSDLVTVKGRLSGNRTSLDWASGAESLRPS